MFPWSLHSSVNCSLPKLSPSAFIRWCTHVNFAEWPILGASYYPGKRATEPAFKLLDFSSSIAFLSSGSFSCAETNQCTSHILPRSERASGRRAPERTLGLLHQRTLGLLHQTWACNLVIDSQGFFCDSLVSIFISCRDELSGIGVTSVDRWADERALARSHFLFPIGEAFTETSYFERPEHLAFTKEVYLILF